MSTRTIRIIDFNGDSTDVAIDMEGILDIYLMILSGDESLRIHRSNGREEIIDPQEFNRIESIYQGGYYIYDTTDPNNIYDITTDPDWLNRKSAEDYLMIRYEKSRKNDEG